MAAEDGAHLTIDTDSWRG